MLIFLIVLFILAAAWGVYALCAKRIIRNELVEFMSILIGFISLIVTFSMAGIIIGSHVENHANLISAESKREALVYQYENGIYLGDAIGEFNSGVIRTKFYQQSPWTNWFYGDYITQIEPIDLSELEVPE